MKAIILAAGQATRLRPVTHDTPKCLLKVGQTTIIDNQIDALKKGGVGEIVVVTGFKKEMLEEHVTKNHPEISFTFVFNPEYSKTRPAYGLWLAKKHLVGPLVYLNADLLCDQDIFMQIIASTKSVTAIQKIEWDEEAVNVILGTDSEILEIGKHIRKDANHGEFIGASKFSEGFVRELVLILDEFEAAADRNRFAVDAINGVIVRGKEKLFGLDVTDKRAIEIDTLTDYENAQLIWNEHEKTRS